MNLVIPVDWRVKPLHQVAHVQSGLALSKATLKDPVLLPYLRVANVQEGYLDLRDVRSVAVERRLVERFALQHGDVLMTEGGDFDKLGRGDLWRAEISPCLHQNHVFAVRTDRSQVLPEFLTALSNSIHGRAYFLSCAKSSTTLASINARQLRNFPVLLPSLDEQHRICAILANWDKSHACAQKILQNRKAQQQGLRQYLLESPAARQWPLVDLGQIAGVCPDPVLKRLPPQFRYITLTDVNAGSIARELEWLGAPDAPKRARRAVAAGDILMSTVRPNLLGYARIDAAHADCVASTGFALLRANAQVAPGYLYHMLFGSSIQRQIQAKVTGSSYPSISLADIGRLRLPLPPLAVQQRVAAILDAAETEVQLARRQREVVAQEKKLWTQRLVTGKWRVLPSGEETESARQPGKQLRRA